jgi:acyl phosphate:glycerol-3-phosphate acyltransferase
VPAVGYILTALVAYLLGSIPTGFLVGKARGIDIRTVGSGNIGATNVLRALGTPAGIFVLLADAVKGWVAVFLAAKWLCGWFCPTADPQTLELFRICATPFAVIGHNYTCWLSFKGGKGIATSAGVLLALVPWSLVIILSIFVLVLALTRYVSLGSMCASFALPFAAWLTGESRTIVLVTGMMGALAIYKHKANIKRLLNGTESRFGAKKCAAVETPQKI